MEIQIKKPNKFVDSNIFFNETGFSLFVREDNWFIGGVENEIEALQALEKHNPPAPTPPTVAEKLALVGLSLDDLKAALGL